MILYGAGKIWYTPLKRYLRTQICQAALSRWQTMKYRNGRHWYKKRKGLPNQARTDTAEIGSEARKQDMDIWPHQRRIWSLPHHHYRHCAAVRHGRDGGSPWAEGAGKPLPQDDRRCGSQNMRHSLFGTAGRSLALDDAGNGTEPGFYFTYYFLIVACCANFINVVRLIYPWQLLLTNMIKALHRILNCTSPNIVEYLSYTAG